MFWWTIYRSFLILELPLGPGVSFCPARTSWSVVAAAVMSRLVFGWLSDKPGPRTG